MKGFSGGENQRSDSGSVRSSLQEKYPSRDPVFSGKKHTLSFIRFPPKVCSQLHAAFATCLLAVIKGFPLCYFTLLLIMDAPHLVAPLCVSSGRNIHSSLEDGKHGDTSFENYTSDSQRDMF